MLVVFQFRVATFYYFFIYLMLKLKLGVVQINIMNIANCDGTNYTQLFILNIFCHESDNLCLFFLVTKIIISPNYNFYTIFCLFFFLAFLKHDWFLPLFIGNTLWLVAIGYYLYITFLGYSCKYKMFV